MKWTRHLKLSWVLGILVITASLLGANHILHAPNAPHLLKAPNPPKGQEAPPREGPPRAGDRNNANRIKGITTTGVVVPESGVIPLVPSVRGEVVEVMVKNDQTVKKGQALMKMDDSLARNQRDLAEVGVKNAAVKLDEATNGMKIFRLKREAQELAIDGWKTKLTGQNEKIRRLDDIVKQKLSANAEIELAAAQSEAKSVELTIKAEEKKLSAIDAEKANIENMITQARLALEAAKLARDKAQYGVDACVLKAPADGVIMEAIASVGMKFGDQGVRPAFLFYSGKLIVKAQVLQEWANRVAVGQRAEIFDYSNNGQEWTGKVKTVGRGFLPKREATALTDLIPQNQEMVLECQIELDPGQKVPFINQKVRIKLSTD